MKVLEIQDGNLTNEHYKDPQSWKDAVLADIFEVIMNEGTYNIR